MVGVKNVPYSLWDCTSTFSEVGVGYSLYFDVLKFLIYIMIAIFIIYGIPSTYFNYVGSVCLQPEQMEAMSQKILSTSFKDRAQMQGSAYQLPEFFGFLGLNFLEFENEI